MALRGSKSDCGAFLKAALPVFLKSPPADAPLVTGASDSVASGVTLLALFRRFLLASHQPVRNLQPATPNASEERGVRRAVDKSNGDRGSWWCSPR
jgi:hypothetical protein